MPKEKKAKVVRTFWRQVTLEEIENPSNEEKGEFLQHLMDKHFYEKCRDSLLYKRSKVPTKESEYEDGKTRKKSKRKSDLDVALYPRRVITGMVLDAPIIAIELKNFPSKGSTISTEYTFNQKVLARFKFGEDALILEEGEYLPILIVAGPDVLTPQLEFFCKQHKIKLYWIETAIGAIPTIYEEIQASDIAKDIIELAHQKIDNKLTE